jgi:hypothetical protein
MDNLQQLVIQETTAPYKRALAQYGTGFLPDLQIEVKYEDLDAWEQAIWDSFVNMIKTKQ